MRVRLRAWCGAQRVVTRAAPTLVFVLAAFDYPCEARTWKVYPDGTGDAPSIQAAIDSAADGDQIVLDEGVFREAIDFEGKTIQISGINQWRTIIDASGLENSCVRFASGESQDAILEQMTITGGSGFPYGASRMGGGVIIDGAEPTLRKLRVVNNQVNSSGGGIQAFGINWFDPEQPIIEECEISGNVAMGNGGAIGFNGLVAPIIRNCLIVNNEAIRGDGGGIWGSTGSSGTLITDNRIQENVAGDHGGGVYISGSTVRAIEATIQRNLVYKNEANGQDSEDVTGGGIYLTYMVSTIEQNTIVFNSGFGGGGVAAGGIGCAFGGEYHIQYNIVAFTGNGNSILCTDGIMTSTINDISWENRDTGLGALPCADWALADGNEIVDPLFCQRDDENFSVQSDSPALTHFASPIGYINRPGCVGNKVFTTWSRMKSLFLE